MEVDTSDSESEEFGVSDASDDGSDSSFDSENEGMQALHDDKELDPRTKDVPLGQLLEQQQSGLLTGRHQRPSQAAGSLRRPGKAAAKGESSAASFKRENKNRPVEQSSKKRVPRLRQVVAVPRRSRDPRFDDTVAAYKDDAFKKRYAFLYDEELPREKEELKKSMNHTKSSSKKEELRSQLTRVEQQIRAIKEERRKKEVQESAKRKEKAAVKAGKKPFFLKKSERKRQELVARFHELKASGRLEKALAKKRKKNAAKDHRYVPASRRTAPQE